MREVEALLNISRWTVLRRCKAGDFKWRYGTRHGHRVKLIHVSTLPLVREGSNTREFDEATIGALVDAHIQARYVHRRVPGVGRVLVEKESAIEQPMRLLKRSGVLDLAHALVRKELLRRAQTLWSLYGYARNKRTGIPRLLQHLNTEAAEIYRSAIATSNFELRAKSRLSSLQGEELLAVQSALELFVAACNHFESDTARARLGPTLSFFKSAFTHEDIRRLTQIEERLMHQFEMQKPDEVERPRHQLVPQVCAELLFRLDRKEPRWRNLLAVSPNPHAWLADRVFPRVHLDSLVPDIASLVVQEMVQLARGKKESPSSAEVEYADFEEEDMQHLAEAAVAKPEEPGNSQRADGVVSLGDIGWTDADLAQWHSATEQPQDLDPQS